MPPLSSLLRGARGATRSGDEAAQLRRQAADHFNLGSADDVSDAQYSAYLAQRGGRDIAQGTRSVVVEAAESGGRAAGSRTALGLGALGLGGGGAYAVGQYTDAQQSQSKTQRQEDYYDRIREIEEMYRNGEITEEEMEQMKADARDAYMEANNSNRGLSPLEVFAGMGQLQKVVLLAVVGLIGVKVLPVAVERFSIPDVDLQNPLK